MENVHYYIGLYQQGRIKLTINTCPMPLNWEQLVPIIQFCNSNRLPIFFCIVNAPFYNTFLSTSTDFIEKVYAELSGSLESLPQETYYEKNNYKQLQDFLHMLHSWNGLIQEYDSNRERLIHLSAEELYRLFKERLELLLIYEEKESLIQETMQYAINTFAPLDDADKKELIISLLNVVRDTIFAASDTEYMKWAREYMNILVYSYERRVAFT